MHVRVKPLLRKPKNYRRKRRRSNKTIEEIPHNITTLFSSYTRRQILPAPPSKLHSPQKILHDNNKSQSDPKHLQSASIMNGDQQVNQIKNVLEFLKKLWKHQLTKNSFRGSSL